MRFTPQFLDELRARLSVSEVVGKRVKLKKAGREWKGLSPFQQEKTPSFYVNDQKGFYHDFSSGKHGDIITFVMETDGLPFAEAVERLAGMAGLPLPAVTPDAARHEQRRRTLHDVMELAANFFAETLASRIGAKARGYLADRAISPATQVQFRLGYAPPPPERFALKEHLGKLGISVEDMIETGLLIGGDDIPVPYDRFRDRVMFPITDLRGRVIAFGGRALEKDVPAKYLNSPETPLFHKGDNLYNHQTARKATHDGSALIVVEGYVDVIAMVTAGFPGAVAPLGTALTENQLALLWKMADEPILCFDGDRAGQKAAYRAADLALPFLSPGKSLRFALLPEGQDPDDLARSGGRGAIEEVIAAARPLADMIWSRELEGGNFATPERRAALEARIKELSNGIRDEVVRRYYRDDFVERLQRTFSPDGGRGGRGNFRQGQGGGGRPFQPRGGQPNRFGGQGFGQGFGGGRRGGLPGPTLLPSGPYQAASPQLAASPIMRGQRSAISRREALILQCLINHPWLLHDHLEEVAALELAHPEAHKLRAAIIAAFANDHHHSPDPEEQAEKMRSDLEKSGFSQVLQRVEGGITTAAVWGAREGAARDDVLATWHQLVALHRQWHSLLRELKDAELALGEDSSEANLAWLRDVKARIGEVDGTEALIEGFGELSGRFQKSV
ncbi:DNA primase [Bradyrhizobium arachidis]|uniref:DNA primase n=1 Tax=Bradyrhizobium TaxID=374 RepID=UPI0021638C86|nr:MULTISPECIES: DNA primase [Bradyrhizobium]MDN4983694.1 DNA primase [Bradyrhizobium sp. WYCCWR 13022]UVO38070.1 DNA primase [Bradyrhizobium arachidis]